ncbi:peptidase inhibitor family I36 protein [Streptomyces lichenis]|uniref:Peptidase inhibitor family I36 protein n=1 Tax=Streptomyces lichenis TaxID=2306967 RepID=A0ABT0I6S5_9ACTN|nr:peptidase inhibitor family I36 protein [Streptomyces lichenis]MCK8677031.1 peptidase inhibitor family I36 protein [Streptomyces lichenis]
MRSTTLLLTAAAVTLTATAAVAAAPATTAQSPAATTGAATTSTVRAVPPEKPASRTAAAGGRLRLGACAPGQLCLWPKEDFRGTRQAHELSTVDVESCVPVPAGTTAASLANRTGRPVTTYQSAECAETGEFETYPGGGTWVPQSPYQVRAFKVWES